MDSTRRRIILFLLSAVVLLSAGFAFGYVRAFDGFYSPEAQLEHEMVEMDFNSRQLYYTNLGRSVDCQRELVKQLQGQIAFVTKLLSLSPRMENRATIEASVQRAQEMVRGRPIASTTP